jgi:predicted RNA-binding Zn-ribbon protein involved in translation (DUF1610 family)
MINVTSDVDESRPSKYEDGWRHVACKGHVQADTYYRQFYCIECGRTVNSKECVRIGDYLPSRGP